MRERGGASSGDLAGVPVLSEMADLLAVKVRKEHASELFVFAARAVQIFAGPFGCENVTALDDGPTVKWMSSCSPVAPAQ